MADSEYRLAYRTHLQARGLLAGKLVRHLLPVLEREDRLSLGAAAIKARMTQKQQDLERGYRLTGLRSTRMCQFGHYGCRVYEVLGRRVHVRETMKMEVARS